MDRAVVHDESVERSYQHGLVTIADDCLGHGHSSVIRFAIKGGRFGGAVKIRLPRRSGEAMKRLRGRECRLMPPFRFYFNPP
jgi:hypothetical protein